VEERWLNDFFDEEYIRLWSGSLTDDRTRTEADGLWALAGLAAGSRVLDAPCGFGRISRALAERGATVLGVDLAQAQVEAAEAGRGDIDAERLRYRCRDLRRPLDEGGFDAALNVFSSLGYGTEEEDLAVLATLREAVRPGGAVVVETNHRDAIVGRLGPGGGFGSRLADGTLMVEEVRLDPATGRAESVWAWWGPRGHGEKRSSLRVYAIHELIRLVERAGLAFVSLHAGCSPEPYRPGGRVALLARRADP